MSFRCFRSQGEEEDNFSGRRDGMMDMDAGLVEWGETFWRACREARLSLKKGEKSLLLSLCFSFPLWEVLPWDGIPVSCEEQDVLVVFLKVFDSEFASDRWGEMQVEQLIKWWIYRKEKKNVITYLELLLDLDSPYLSVEDNLWHLKTVKINWTNPQKNIW